MSAWSTRTLRIGTCSLYEGQGCSLYEGQGWAVSGSKTIAANYTTETHFIPWINKLLWFEVSYGTLQSVSSMSRSSTQSPVKCTFINLCNPQETQAAFFSTISPIIWNCRTHTNHFNKPSIAFSFFLLTLDQTFSFFLLTLDQTFSFSLLTLDQTFSFFLLTLDQTFSFSLLTLDQTFSFFLLTLDQTFTFSLLTLDQTFLLPIRSSSHVHTLSWSSPTLVILAAPLITMVSELILLSYSAQSHVIHLLLFLPHWLSDYVFFYKPSHLTSQHPKVAYIIPHRISPDCCVQFVI